MNAFICVLCVTGQILILDMCYDIKPQMFANQLLWFFLIQLTKTLVHMKCSTIISI